MGRRLERHVDWDLVERIEANGPIVKPRKFKTVKVPRPADSYRGAKRNAAKAQRYLDKVRRREEAAERNRKNNGGAEGAV